MPDEATRGTTDAATVSLPGQGSGMKSRLGECLLDADRITRFDLDAALAQQKETGGSLGEILVGLGVLSEEELITFLSGQLNIPLADLAVAQFEEAAIDAFSEGRARQYLCMPIRYVDDHVEVAMHDPLNLDALEEVAKATGKKVRVMLALKEDILGAAEDQYLRQSHRYAREMQMQRALQEQAQAGVKVTGKTRTFALVSNKGGVGKTHIAINLAQALAEDGHDTLLIDADFGTANVGTKIGYQPKVTLVNLLRGDRIIQDIVVGTAHGFDLIAGLPGEFKLANMPAEHRVRFLESFLDISTRYDAAIFDLSAGIDETVLDLALGAHETLIVITPQEIVAGYSCLKALFYRFIEQEKRLTKRLKNYQRRRVFQPRVIVNQVDSGEMAELIFAKVRVTAKKYLRVRGQAFSIEPMYGGFVCYDHKGMRDAEMRRTTYLSRHPKTKTAACFHHLASEFMKPDSLRDTEVDFGPWYARFAGLMGGQ